MRKQSPIDVDRVYHHCLKVIESSPGTPAALESEWALARRFDVSRRVARRALQQLVREGRALCHAGKGYTSRPALNASKIKRLKVGIVHHRPTRAYAGVRNVVLSQLCQALEAHEFTSAAIPIQTLENGLITQRVLGGYSVDAYLLVSVPPSTQAFFASQGLPTVTLGNTTRDLGLASISLNELEIAREVTEQLLASGHRLVVLVQEKTLNLGAERCRVGFLYAHHRQMARFHPDSIVRVDRERIGMTRDLLQLFRMAPSAMLVESVPLLEMIWSRASAAHRKWLEETEVIVMSRDFTGEFRHRAKFIEFDPQWEVEAAVRLLEDCVYGRKGTTRHIDIPWKLTAVNNSGKF